MVRIYKRYCKNCKSTHTKPTGRNCTRMQHQHDSVPPTMTTTTMADSVAWSTATTTTVTATMDGLRAASQVAVSPGNHMPSPQQPSHVRPLGPRPRLQTPGHVGEPTVEHRPRTPGHQQSHHTGPPADMRTYTPAHPSLPPAGPAAVTRMTTPGQQQQGHPPFTPAGPAAVPRMTTPGQQQQGHPPFTPAGPAVVPRMTSPGQQQQGHPPFTPAGPTAVPRVPTPGQQQQGRPPFTPAGPTAVPRVPTPGQQQLTHAGPANAPRIPPSSHQQQAYVPQTADPSLPVRGHQQPVQPGPPVGTRTHTTGHQQRPQGMHAAVNRGPHVQGHHQPFPQQQVWPSQPQQQYHQHPQAAYHQQPQSQPPPAQDLTPALQAITTTLGQVCDRLTSLEQSRIPPPSAMPSAGVATEAILADEVRRRLAYLQESSTSSDSDNGVRKHHTRRGKSRKKRSGRGRTTEDFVVRDMPWPHHGVYKGPERRAATFDTLSVQEFVFGYVGNIDAAPDKDKAPMLQHLRELMHDAMYHPWASVRNYHGVVLGQMEQAVLTWTDRAVIQDLRAQYARTQSTSAQGEAHPVKPCFAYQRGQCDIQGDHHNAHGDKLHHCCAYCWRLKGKAFPHSEMDCRTKVKQVPHSD